MEIRSILATIIVIASTLTCAVGQRLAPLPIEDALDIREFGQFVTPGQFSPDGQWLTYVVTNNRRMIANSISEDRYMLTGVPPSAIGADIFVSNTRTGESRSLTGGEGNNWFPAWSPDGRHLAFFSDRTGTGQAQLWEWNVATDQIKRVSDASIRASQEAQWLPDGSGVLLTILPEGLTPEDYAKQSAQFFSKTTPFAPGAAVRVYRSPAVAQDAFNAPSSDPWRLGGHPVDLVIVNFTTGNLRRIVRNLDNLGLYSLSPEGSHIAFTVQKRFEKAGSQQILWDLKVLLIATLKATAVASDIRLGYGGASFSWSPDGKRLAYQTGGPLEQRKDCFIVSAISGASRNITLFPPETMEYSPRPPLWADNNRFVYLLKGGSIWRASAEHTDVIEFVHLPNYAIKELIADTGNRLWSCDSLRSTVVLVSDTTGIRSGFYKVDLQSGHAEELLVDDRCHACMNAIQHVFGSGTGDRLAYFSEDAGHENELWLTDPDFRNQRRLTHLNPRFDQYRMGSARSVEWHSLDGDLLHGALLLPAAYQEGKRYPLVVWVYGNARSSNSLNRFGLGFETVFNFQVLATRGYAVLFPDAPQHMGTPMVDLAKTVLPGVNKVIEMGIADPERLGIMGQSYGGYCALSLIVQTKRFRAAIISDGYADLLGHYGMMSTDGAAYGTSIEEQGQGLMGGTPWQFRDRYIENSPLFYLSNVDTPVLIVHGAKDSNVLPFLADQVFVSLRRLGKDVDYAEYEGEEHSPPYWSYANQLDFSNRMIGWFEKYLH